MRDLGKGFGFLLRGQRWVLGHGRWFGFGLLPGLVTLVLYAAVLVGLAYGGDDLVAWLTPFADEWSGKDVFRGALTVVLWALVLLIAVVAFTAVTLLVGEPFYERLSEEVDRSTIGTVHESGIPMWRELLVSARDSMRILVRVALFGVLLFAAGFVPVVGQTVVPVVAVMTTGFFLAQELVAVAGQRRRIGLTKRLNLLRSRRLMTIGFGAPLAAAFLVPFVAVVLMPGAVAGATLLTQELLGERDDHAPHDDDRTPYDDRSPYGA
ncbi:EI24 domain-containing protein [Streptomyces sp. NPDC060194]|uniref:EI24 domain-containing protein n=1 Tax=Streptomyces sp. NPDC060194 TaxID=3347069 RepID=UPI00364DA08B